METPAGEVVQHQVWVGPLGVRVAAALVLVRPLRVGVRGQPVAPEVGARPGLTESGGIPRVRGHR